MGSNTTTFALRGRNRSDAVTTLLARGFEFGTTRPVSSTLLDTFDGRLHRAGLRLVLHEIDDHDHDQELVLDGVDVVAVHLRVTMVPRFANDLPAGPFHERVATVVGARALLPLLKISAVRTTARLCDVDGKTVVTARLYDDLVAVGRDDIHVPPATLEVNEVIGFRKPVRTAVDALGRLGLERLECDTLTSIANIACIDLAGFSSSPRVALDPTMPAIVGFREVLLDLVDTIDANWQGTIDQLDPEFLHDLRIAVRRTRAVVARGKSVLPPEIVTEARAGIAWLGDLTAPARDLDVHVMEWDGYVRPLGTDALIALAPVRTVLEARLSAAHAALEAGLRSAAANELRATWRGRLDHLTTLEPRGPHADRPLGRVVGKRIASAQARLVERGRLIQPDTPAAQVHDLRKDAKKLRYLIECFGSVLPTPQRKRFVTRLKALQNNLGVHQDAEVHLALIREIAEDLHRRHAAADTMLAIGQLTERLEQIRLGARAEFAERFAAYDTTRTQRTLDVMLDGLRP